MAIVAADVNNNGTLTVYEADYHSNSLRAVPLDKWLIINNSLRCRVYISSVVMPFNNKEATIAWAILNNWIGVPYDYTGAIRARRWGARWLTRWVLPNKEDDSTLLCNEAVGIHDRRMKRIIIDKCVGI